MCLFYDQLVLDISGNNDFNSAKSDIKVYVIAVVLFMNVFRDFTCAVE